MIPVSEIAGIVLAGGRASRMNFQDKALLPLHGRPLIEYVASIAGEQVNRLAISVNRNPQKYDYLGYPVIPDYRHRYAGPLVGIYSAMRWLKFEQEDEKWSYLACFAADVPSFPGNLIKLLGERLLESNSEVACCRCDQQLQPLFSLWSLDTLAVLDAALNRGIFGPKLLLPEMKSVIVDFKKIEPGYFFNINSEKSLTAATQLIEPQLRG